MNGWQVISLLRADPTTLNIPIIALTAHSMENDRQTTLESGADGFVTKRFDMKFLLGEMDRLLTASK